MKKKMIILAMAVCLVVGSAEAGWGMTCKGNSQISGIIGKFQQYVMGKINIEKYLPEFEKPGGGNSGAGNPDENIPEQNKPESPDQSKPEQGGEETGNDQITTQSSMTEQVVALTNKERKAKGVGTLKSNSQLNRLAKMKAEDMAKNNYFSHTSPTYGSAFDMMNTYKVSYKTAGENIAKGQKTAKSVMTGWMNSSGHRANILNSAYTEIGVGYAKASNGTTYWVQIFKG